MALTIQDLYQNVLGRDPAATGDPGLAWWQNYMGPTIEKSEIDAFVAAAQAEKPGATYRAPATPTLVVPDNYPVFGPSGPEQTPISNVPVVTPPPRPPLVVTPVPKTGPTTTTASNQATISPDVAAGFQRAMTRPTYKQTRFASRQGPAPTLEQLYQNVLGRAGDPRGLEFWRNYVGSSIDPDEIAAFVAAAQAERPGAFYAGSNAPPRPVSYADTALLTGSSGALPGISSVIGRTYLPGGQYLNPTGVSTLVQAPTAFSGTPTDPRTSKPFTIADRPAANVAPVEGKKAGGLASLADKVQSAGRNGDTMLAHITPEEAGILKLMGGSGTINPRTGLPEFFNPLREIRNLGRSIEKNVRQAGRSIDRRITQPIIGGLNSLAERLGPIGQLAAAYFGGPIGAGIYAGFAAPGGDFNVKKAAQAAALTYAGRTMIPGSGAPSGVPIDGVNPFDYAPVGFNTGVPIAGPEAIFDPNVISYTPDPNSFVGGASPIDQFASAPTVSDIGAGSSVSPGLTESEMIPGYGGEPAPISDSLTQRPSVFQESPTNFAGSIYDIGKEGLKAVGIDTLPKAVFAANMGASLIQGQREREKFKEEQARRIADLNERRRRYREQAESIMSRYPIRFAARGGMLDDIDDPRDEVGYGMAGGGMPPRFLSGGGDGMSDSIPAVISDKQPARLADGEFVIPADVVSHLGNGSSKAGAKQLYAMMDRIRKARTGTTKQGREVKPRHYMPV